jgi:polyribonucleotide nucleotidyltransferase
MSRKKEISSPSPSITFEKQYAVGKIPQSFLRREGRPDEHATLSARLIDRPIRPLIRRWLPQRSPIVNTVMSAIPTIRLR